MAAQIDHPNKIRNVGNYQHQVDLRKLENKLKSIRKYNLCYKKNPIIIFIFYLLFINHFIKKLKLNLIIKICLQKLAASRV